MVNKKRHPNPPQSFQQHFEHLLYLVMAVFPHNNFVVATFFFLKHFVFAFKKIFSNFIKFLAEHGCHNPGGHGGWILVKCTIALPILWCEKLK